LAIALSRFQLQVCAACLARGCEGPPWCVTRHDLARFPRESGRTERLVAMRPCTVMDVHPTDVHARLPDAVPVPCAGDDRKVSRAAPIPGHHEAGALGGGASRAASPQNLRTKVRCWRCLLQNRAVSRVPSPLSPTTMQWYGGNPRIRRASSRRTRCVGV
jgi:hypothetical protein